MGNFLASPKTEKTSEVKEFAHGIVGGSCMQGWRREMEDQHIITLMPSLEDHLYLCVFDGHGGDGAAKYAEQHLVSIIEDTHEWKQYLADESKDPNLLGQALTAAFIQIDVMMREHQEGTDGRDCSGCTSVTCMVTPKHFVCANAGDSRCVLGSDGKTIPMSFDHKPNDAEESARILSAGGSVSMGRVDGDLAVSRAFGDFQYKLRFDLEAGKQKVSCVPDIKIVERTDKDEVLILACDGLWDVFSNEETIAAIHELFGAGEEDVSLVAEEMLDLSLHKGSRDNISAVILRMKAAKIGPPEGGGVMARRNVREQELAREQAEEEAEEAGRMRGNVRGGAMATPPSAQGGADDADEAEAAGEVTANEEVREPSSPNASNNNE